MVVDRRDVGACRVLSSSSGGWVGTAAAAASCSRMASAWGSRQAVGATAPAAMRPAPVSLSTATATEQVAMTMALRVPTFAKRLGHAAPGRRTATISSSGRSEVCPGETSRSPIGILRTPLGPATSTSASCTSSAGRLSPAGLAVARSPPRVARARICGEPTVTTAPARAATSGRRAAMSAIGCAAPMRIQRSSRSMPCNSGTAVRSSTPASSVRPKFTSTMRSVPPAIGVSSGRRVRTSTASLSVVGRMAVTSANPGTGFGPPAAIHGVPKGYVQLRSDRLRVGRRARGQGL